ncbi:ArsB/NhaD family transporter [bacterium]|nr:ArsB/NhaD family transporter [bacterium]
MKFDYKIVVALVAFVFAYFAVVTDKISRTKAVVFGAMLLLVVGVLEAEVAWVEYIDFEVLGLLIGMMVIAGVIGETGIFQFVALKAVRWTKGRYWLLTVVLSVITAVFSAFLDNVTTILLLGPITIFASDALHRKPLLMLISVTLASNIGGMGTLIGDPPHMLIGSAVGLSFNDFIVNLGPMAIIALIATLGLVFVMNRRQLRRTGAEYSPKFDESRYLKDKRKTIISLVILTLTIVGFTILPSYNISVAVVALFGASALMLLHKGKIDKLLGHVEWPLIFFFFGLFVITGALQETGVVAWVGDQLAGVTTDPLFFTILILWASTLGVAFISAVPFVAVMIPIIMHATALMGLSPAESEPIWWSLSIAAAIGGNGTVIGAAATMAAVSISERTSEPITFRNYLRYGMPTLIFTLLISTGYLWLRYFVWN